jgi:glycogen synthase
MAARIRLAYVSGPIDAIQVYEEFRSNKESDYFGTIYLLEVLRLLQQADAHGLIITTLPGSVSRVQEDSLTVVNIPMPAGKGGAFYHVGMIGWTIRSMVEIVRFRSNVALFTAGQNYFWLASLLKLFGVRLAASLHCTLWSRFSRTRFHNRLFVKLNGRLFYPACDHVQAVSDEVIRQIVESSASLRSRPLRFIPTYDPARFAGIAPPEWPPPGERFRLLYVGRLEKNKGVLDLVKIMVGLERLHPGRFVLDICGEGSALSELEQAIADACLSKTITVDGQCTTAVLSSLYQSCHAVIVPTRSDFEEGYAKVAAEAVLSRRPLVMSAAVPALADLAPATSVARVDDVDDYVRAIRSLSEDEDFYLERVRAADGCRSQYLDERNGYGAALRIGLQPLLS